MAIEHLEKRKDISIIKNQYAKMNKRILPISIVAVSLCFFLCSFHFGKSPEYNAIVKDSTLIMAGERSFNTNCSGCHNFKQDGIGPQLSGITTQASEDWITQFIKNSQQMIASKDERAVQVFNKYKKAVMPVFETLPNNELHAL